MRPNCEILMRFIMPCKQLRSKSAFNMHPPKVFGGLKNEEGLKNTSLPSSYENRACLMKGADRK